MSRPRHLLRAWPSLRRGLQRAKRRALFTDYDGTLTRIRRRPELAALDQRMRSALQDAGSASRIAGVVSGRRLKDVEARVGIAGIWYAGVHGFFLRSPGGKGFSLASPAVRKVMARLSRRLQRSLRGLAGIEVEPKRATVAVHYRRAGRAARKRAHAIVESNLTPDLDILQGKKVWEFFSRPGPRQRAVNKWTAIEFILRREGFRRRDHAAVAYLGDDVTDELVFRKLSGITVAVGKRRHTAARYYLRSPAEVRKFLAAWKESEP